MTKQATAAIIIPDGFEEIEAITTLDILRRGSIEVALIGYKSRTVTGAHQLSIQTDDILSNVLTKLYNCLILPGGPGCYNMRGDDALLSFVKKHAKEQKFVCAICAAPLILNDAGILKDKHYTTHPCTRDELIEAITEQVVVDDRIITGSGPGASMQFGLTILKYLTTPQIASLIAQNMLYQGKI